MLTTSTRSSPRTVTSRCNIKYQPSRWKLQEFEIGSGETLCQVGIVEMEGSMLVWLGGVSERRLGEMALGMPSAAGRDALATALTAGAESAAPALALRLTAALRRPVYVCLGTALDRFTMPLVERTLITILKDTCQKL